MYLVLGHEEAYFLKDSKSKYPEYDIIKMLVFLVDNMFVVSSGKVFKKIVGIQKRTNCDHLLPTYFSTHMNQNLYSLSSQPKRNSWHIGTISRIGTSMMFCQ